MSIETIPKGTMASSPPIGTVASPPPKQSKIKAVAVKPIKNAALTEVVVKKVKSDTVRLARDDMNIRVTEFYHMVSYSFFDVLSYTFNKPNLATGGTALYSFVHFMSLLLGIFFIMFTSAIHSAFGCYTVKYGSDVTIDSFSFGRCDDPVAPNIGSEDLGNGPITVRVYAFMIVGAVLIIITIGMYVVTFVRISHMTHTVVHMDTEIVMAELKILDPATGKPHRMPSHLKEMHFQYEAVYWWYFDVLAFMFNIPNQMQNGFWSLTWLRIALNAWTVYLWPYVYTNWAYDVNDQLYYCMLIIPALVSLGIYLAGLLEMHLWLEEVKYTVIKNEITKRTNNIDAAQIADIKKVFQLPALKFVL